MMVLSMNRDIKKIALEEALYPPRSVDHSRRAALPQRGAGRTTDTLLPNWRSSWGALREVEEGSKGHPPWSELTADLPVRSSGRARGPASQHVKIIHSSNQQAARPPASAKRKESSAPSKYHRASVILRRYGSFTW